MSSAKSKKDRKLASHNKPGETVRKREISKKNNLLWPLLVMVVLSFVLYGKSINYGYILDDEMVITKNAYVLKGMDGIPDIFKHDTFLGYFQSKDNLYLLQGGRYRPLSLASFALETSVFGANKPAVSHFINILLYALSGFLLFLVIYNLNRTAEKKQVYFRFALLASLLWLLHPIHSECVANIKGRDEILATMGSLAALFASLKFADTGRKRWIVLSSLFFFLGLLSKENTMTFLAIIPLTLYFFRSQSTGAMKKLLIPIAGVSLLFILIRYQALGYMLDHGRSISNLMNDSFLGMSFAEKYATIFYTLGWYIKLLVWPHPLTHDYYPYHVPVMNWSSILVWASLALYLFLGIYALLKWKRKSMVAYSFLFYLITLSIASNIFFSIGAFMNERFLYTPSIAFSLLTAFFIIFTLPRFVKNITLFKNIAIGSFLIIGGLYAYKTLTRVPDWENNLTLNRSALPISKNSARANCYHAVTLYTEVYLRTQDPVLQAKLVDTMETYLKKAIDIYPDYENAYQMKTGVASARYNLDHDVNKFYNELELILRKIPQNFVSIDYIGKILSNLYPSFPSQTIDFSVRNGYQFLYKEKKNVKHALLVMQVLKDYAPDPAYLQYYNEVYAASGMIR